MKTFNSIHQQAVDLITWGLLSELNFKRLLKEIDTDKIYNVIYEFLKGKIESKELSVGDIDEVRENISQKARILFNRIGEDWHRGDDGCYDIATAAVALGKQNYEKCLKDHDYLVSMRRVTKEYENVLYPFNEIIDEYGE